MSPVAWSSHVRGVLRDKEGRVLMLESGSGPALPDLRIEGFGDDELERVRSAFAELLGLRVAILRHLTRQVDRIDTSYQN